LRRSAPKRFVGVRPTKKKGIRLKAEGERLKAKNESVGACLKVGRSRIGAEGEKLESGKITAEGISSELTDRKAEG